MIGVTASPADLETAAEFFELFKTAWEPAVAGRKYDAIVSTDGQVEHLEADLVVVYGSTPYSCDGEAGTAVAQLEGVDVHWKASSFPIFGGVAVFDCDEAADITVQDNEVHYACNFATHRTRRVGYDLFREIRQLLTVGQPAQAANTPTLELHIALLRHWLVQAQIPFIEILPRPAGYNFICCLTHDIDFFGVRRQRFDRTLVGFAARASLGSLVDLARGRRSMADTARNFKAFCSLPFVFLGLARDFWRPLEDYSQVEDLSQSTFFVVPFKDRPGAALRGTIDGRRAVRYQASEVANELRAAAGQGSEVALHGIDAWCSAEAGRAEMREIAATIGTKTCGVRMHWLYFSDESPRELESAGFDYDSTLGYNEAVGYRAGTSQVFHLPGTERMMELPLSIMDSALFSSGRMALSPEQAQTTCRRLVAQARHFGGTLVINWHCRSLAPERLWRQPYEQLLEEIAAGDRTWFATAGDTVNWFRWRRSIRFTEDASSAGVDVRVSAPASSDPGGVIRVYRPGPNGAEVIDHPFDGGPSGEVNVESFYPTRQIVLLTRTLPEIVRASGDVR